MPNILVLVTVFYGYYEIDSNRKKKPEKCGFVTKPLCLKGLKFVCCHGNMRLHYPTAEEA